ncbi:MAG: hypothetical protein D6719_03500 [Candidatus Dadabacteria bacterium]|nr:MAG: hypothetical protein D6719_03500 [Candidatus Dadabacteria bacterium]
MQRFEPPVDSQDLSALEKPASGSTREPLTPQEIYKKVAPAVVAMKHNGHAPGHAASRTVDLNHPSSSYGSGFIYDRENRIVVTNWHVAAAEKQLLVKVDDQFLPADIIGVDPRHDLAVLKVSGQGPLAAEIELGSPADLNIGDPVYTIGSPFGFDGTLGQGIVSGPMRDIDSPNGQTMVDLIQHNAVTNPGNSGGVLVNQFGEVVGMNTMIMSLSGGYDGFTLSTSIEHIKKSVDELLKTGQITTSTLGITVAPTKAGLAVIWIDPESAAGRAGLTSEIGFKKKFGLVGEAIPDFSKTLFITEVDGVQANSRLDFESAILKNSGEPVKLTLKEGPDGTPFKIELIPDRVPVPDAIAKKTSLAKVEVLEPSCQHLTMLSQIAPLSDQDIEHILSKNPVALVLDGNSMQANLYFDREEMLAVVLENGKSPEWLDKQLKEVGFSEAGASEGVTRYTRSLSNRPEGVVLMKQVSAIMHGKEPPKIDLRVQMFSGDIPEEVAEVLKKLLK